MTLLESPLFSWSLCSLSFFECLLMFEIRETFYGLTTWRGVGVEVLADLGSLLIVLV